MTRVDLTGNRLIVAGERKLHGNRRILHFLAAGAAIVICVVVAAALYVKYPAGYLYAIKSIRTHSQEFDRLRQQFQSLSVVNQIDVRFARDLSVIPDSSDPDFKLSQESSRTLLGLMTKLRLLSIKKEDSDVEFLMRLDRKLGRQFMVGAVHSDVIAGAIKEGRLSVCADIWIVKSSSGQCVTPVKPNWFAVYRWVSLSDSG